MSSMNVPHSHLMSDFLTNIVEEFQIGWIKSAGEHEILPYHQSQFVCHIIEFVRLIDLQKAEQNLPNSSRIMPLFTNNDTTTQLTE